MAAFHQNVRRQVIAIATGGGKTIVAANLVHAYQSWLATFPRTHRRMIVMAHREELLHQTVDKMLRVNPTLRIDIEQASRRASDHADVVVASVQTLSAQHGRRLQQFDPARVRIVVADECHHSTCPSYVRVFEHFGMLPPPTFLPPHPAPTYHAALAQQRERLAQWDAQPPPPRLLLGLTATPIRGDRVGLEAVFQQIVYSKTIREMIREQFLCPLLAVRVESLTSLDEIRVKAGDFDVKDLSRAVNVLARNKLASQAYRAHAEQRRAVVFCVDVEHARLMAMTFTLDGIEARHIDGTMGSDERAQILRDFREQRFQVLCNCQILTEGWDDAGVACIIHARPTKSSLLYTQMTGRGTRTHPGKTNCLIIDIVDATSQHSLVTLATLFGLPSGFNFHGDDVLRSTEAVEALKRTHPNLSGVSLHDIQIQSAFVDLFGPLELDVSVRQAEYPWCRVYGHHVMSIPLQAPGKVYFDVFPTGGQWEAWYRTSGTRGTCLGTATTLEGAIEIAENWYHTGVPKEITRMLRLGDRAIRALSDEQYARLASHGIALPKATPWWSAETILAFLQKGGLA